MPPQCTLAIQTHSLPSPLVGIVLSTDVCRTQEVEEHGPARMGGTGAWEAMLRPGLFAAYIRIAGRVGPHGAVLPHSLDSQPQVV